jgi:hypothetical protein
LIDKNKLIEKKRRDKKTGLVKKEKKRESPRPQEPEAKKIAPYYS